MQAALRVSRTSLLRSLPAVATGTGCNWPCCSPRRGSSMLPGTHLMLRAAYVVSVATSARVSDVSTHARSRERAGAGPAGPAGPTYGFRPRVEHMCAFRASHNSPVSRKLERTGVFVHGMSQCTSAQGHGSRALQQVPLNAPAVHHTSHNVPAHAGPWHPGAWQR